MKKNLWLAALVGIALTGCVNDENNPITEKNQLLSFGKPVYKTQSRAVPGEITSTNPYSTNESFVVFCRRYSGSFNGWLNSTNSVDFFDSTSAQNQSKGIKAQHDANGSAWATVNDYYWPGVGYSLAFAAYSPADAKGTISYGTTGLSIEDFETESTSEDQYDLLYSDRTIDCTNELYGKVGKAVTLTFRHALSSIVFATVENVPGRTYTINNIKLVGNFVTGGDFSENHDESTSISAPEWSNTQQSDETYIPSITDVPVPETAYEFTAGTHALLLIPQTVGSNAKVVLTYTVTPENGTPTTYPDVEIELKKFLTTSDNAITSWEINKRYVYVIKFGGSNKIFFTPNVADWESGLTASYTIN